MERAQWLEKMRRMTEALYDRGSPQYWVTWGFTEDEMHRAYLQKFLERVAQATGGKPGLILSAACGAGRYDGLLLEAGQSVVGTGISAGMLERAWIHQAGLAIEEEGHGSGWHHFLTGKSSLYPPTDNLATRGA